MVKKLKATQARQGKERQAKGRPGGQMTYSESGWCLPDVVACSFDDLVEVQILLDPAPCVVSSYRKMSSE